MHLHMYKDQKYKEWNKMSCLKINVILQSLLHYKKTFILKSLFTACVQISAFVKQCVINSCTSSWIRYRLCIFCCFQGAFGARLLDINIKLMYSHARWSAHKYKLHCKLFSEIIKYLQTVWINVPKSWLLNSRNCPPLQRAH